MSKRALLETLFLEISLPNMSTTVSSTRKTKLGIVFAALSGRQLQKNWLNWEHIVLY